MKNKQITKSQHFVPRFYLKRFALEGLIQVFDVRAKRIGKPRPFGSVCYEKFFYAVETGVQDEISQAYEESFGRFENIIDKALPGIAERALNRQLTDDDLDKIAGFMSAQWIRTRYFREWLNKMYCEILKQLFKKLPSFSGFPDYVRSTEEGRETTDEQMEELKRFIQSGAYEIPRSNNALHFKFMRNEDFIGFYKLLLAKKWRIIHSKESHHFITSDNPVVQWIPPTKGIFGPTFMDRVHFLPLTPNILIETTPPGSMNPEQQPVDRLSYCAVNGKRVLMFNKMIANHAHQYAYASQTDEFKQLLRAI